MPDYVKSFERAWGALSDLDWGPMCLGCGQREACCRCDPSPDTSATTTNGPAPGSASSESAEDGAASPPCGLQEHPGPDADLSGETCDTSPERRF